MKYKRFKYDIYGKIMDITSQYLVVKDYKEQTLHYLKCDVLHKLKSRIGKYYYITLDDNQNVIDMVRIKYEE